MQAAVVSQSSDPADPVQAAPKKTSDDSFVIGADDVLAVNVWKEPDISRSVPVRSDGKITLPLVGELQAGGQTPRPTSDGDRDQASEAYISEPEVTVMVQEVRSQRFNILGQVSKPGSYLISNSAQVLDAIAMAGGFRDFAKKKSIYVLRPTPDGGQIASGLQLLRRHQGEETRAERRTQATRHCRCPLKYMSVESI